MHGGACRCDQESGGRVFKAYQASSPEAEVDGRTVLIVSGGMLVQAVARELLETEGLDLVKPAGWYPMQSWLNIYRRISERLGTDTLFSIGRRVPYAADFPVERMFDVPSALAAIDVAYHLSHRNGEIGHYLFVDREPGRYEIHCDTPYNNDFNLGIVTSLTERYRGRDKYGVRMKHRPADPRKDNACIIEVFRV